MLRDDNPGYTLTVGKLNVGLTSSKQQEGMELKDLASDAKNIFKDARKEMEQLIQRCFPEEVDSEQIEALLKS